MTDPIPQSTSELLADIEREWKALWRVVDRLTPQQMVAPDSGGWSPKDNLAHLTEWMNVLMGYHLDNKPSHEVMRLPQEVTKDWDMEVINPVLYARNRDRSPEDVVEESQRVYAALMQKLRSMPFEELMRPRHADDPEQRPVLLWVLGDTTEHFAEHRETIEKTL
ncbi:MAG TPA: ClbS/DfsB family four-helix bundle protein [Anaerolineales bacterium]|nr:ClbS/DfsB family four-helix bundle protein [Anaerolineales bacterium]